MGKIKIYPITLQSMKLKLIIVSIMCLMTSLLWSQARIILPDSTQITTNPDSLDLLPRSVPNIVNQDSDTVYSVKGVIDTIAPPRFTAWKINERTGDRYSVPMDTLLFNYQHKTLPDGEYTATGYLGNLGSPMISKIFFDRNEKDNFVFYDAYYPYNKDPEKQLFYNMRVPYSQLNYQSAGSREDKEEKFSGKLSLNFGKKLNVGFDADFIQSRGLYNSQSVKHLDWVVYGNYLSDRIEAHAFASSAAITQYENGGIANDLFITQPDSMRSIGQDFTSKDIPTKFSQTWNRMQSNQYYFTGKYNLGFKEKTDDPKKDKFVPVASVILTSRYRQQYRRFLSYDTAYVDQSQTIQAIDTVYRNIYYPGAVNDSTRFSSLKNTLALSMREGFRDWVKFGLTAFVEYDIRKFSMNDTTGVARLNHSENSAVIGGILNKQQGDNFRFNIQADLGVLGYNLGELKALGNIETGFKIADKNVFLSADAYIKNLKPKYLEENYQSKYFWWNKNFEDIRRVYIGGKLSIPFTNTTLSLGVENIQNFIYLDANKQSVQENENIQILMARLDQRLQLGVFNWDNEVVYQTTSNDFAIPVPLLSLYSNMYLKTKIANELTFQFGVDAHWHTKYYAPGYEPALLQFYNQREIEISEYPISTIYANMHLKQTRFFVMMYNVAPLLMSPDYFSLPHYPVNPMMLKLGISVNLYN